MNQHSYQTVRDTCQQLHTHAKDHITRVVRNYREMEKNGAAPTPDQLTSKLCDVSFSRSRVANKSAPHAKKIAWIQFYTKELKKQQSKGAGAGAGAGAGSKVPISDQVQAIAKKWRKLSDAQRKPFEELEKKDEERHVREKAAYEAQCQVVGDSGHRHINFLRGITKLIHENEVALTKSVVEMIQKWDAAHEEADDDAMLDTIQNGLIGTAGETYVNTKHKPDPNHPATPMNCWQLFCAEQRANDAEKGVKFTSMSESSKRHSALWKAMGEEERRPYKEKADVLKAQHEEMNAEIAQSVFRLTEVSGRGCANSSSSSSSSSVVVHHRTAASSSFASA
jgi:hypothetical protein